MTKYNLSFGIFILLLSTSFAKTNEAEQERGNSPVSFVATELLGRPTDNSITVNAIADTALEVFFEYGTAPSTCTNHTDTTTFPGNSPIEMIIAQLQPNTKYYYRMRYREPGAVEFTAGEEHFFHTHRTVGSTFTFTIQADSHLRWALDGSPSGFDTTLYRRALQNAAIDTPDFHIDLGDAFSGRQASTYEYAVQYHLEQRPFFGLLCHSAPLFLVIGNHEHECGWELDGTAENRAVWAAKAQKLYYLNPAPDDFYSGDTTVHDHVGVRENYYAWEWGDALFVVLDPFWYTTTCPHNDLGCPPEGGSEDGWDWTLGYDQYQWLKHTLEDSDARFKFVFSHNMTAGAGSTHHQLYARGGIEGAHLWEWGGYNDDGTWGFDDQRPGWGIPTHQLMVANNVTIFFHGHDHAFVKQELDSIVYQEMPAPSDATYGIGHTANGGYESGDLVYNSGHLRVKVSPSAVTVDYVRAYRPQDEDDIHKNGDIDYTYTITADSNSIHSEIPDVLAGKHFLQQNYPNPFHALTTIAFYIPRRSNVSLAVFTPRGQKVKALLDRNLKAGMHTVSWNGSDDYGKRLMPGIYTCELKVSGFREVKKMLLLR